MTRIELSPFKSNEIKFITKYVDVLTPLVISELLSNLLIAENKLADLNEKAVKYCGPPSKKKFRTFP